MRLQNVKVLRSMLVYVAILTMPLHLPSVARLTVDRPIYISGARSHCICICTAFCRFT